MDPQPKILFTQKHVSFKAASSRHAQEISCQRNVNLPYKQTGMNTVLFGNFSFMPSYQGENDRCGAFFNDIFVCRDVPHNPTDLQQCLDTNIWTRNPRCKNCKNKYTVATMFYVEVLKNSGHFDNRSVQYKDNQNNWHTINSGSC